MRGSCESHLENKGDFSMFHWKRNYVSYTTKFEVVARQPLGAFARKGSITLRISAPYTISVRNFIAWRFAPEKILSRQVGHELELVS